MGASNGGQPCMGKATETEVCHAEDCLVNCVWGAYGDWTSCSKTCGGGEKSRTRNVAIPASNGGQSCGGNDTETVACKTEGCPVNCVWGTYGAWTSCSQTCGEGTKSRSRKVSTPASNGGQPCKGKDTETNDCNVSLYPPCPGILLELRNNYQNSAL